MTSTEEAARQEYSYLRRYVLKFFVDEKGLTYPKEWKRRELEWARFLCEDDKPKSAKTKRDIVIAVNRFVKWLHKLRPEDTELVVFEPFTKQQFKSIEAKRDHDGEVHETKYIADSDWKVISKKAPERISALIHLAHGYGLRRNEAMALGPEDVRREYLRVHRQLKRIGKTAPTKGLAKRETPHWLVKPAQAYAWVTKLKEMPPMHPRTFSEEWAQFVDGLVRAGEISQTYTLHDLRHTFITKALRKVHARDVQLAVGHKNILTTMSYAKDDRDLADEAFIPEAS
jgi:integrase